MESPVIEIKTNPILDEKSSIKKLQKYKQAVYWRDPKSEWYQFWDQMH